MTYLLGRKDSEPSKAAQDARLLFLILECCFGRDGGDEILFVRRWGRDDLLGSLLPRDWFLAEALFFIFEEANVNENLDEFWEAPISQGTPWHVSELRLSHQATQANERT